MKPESIVLGGGCFWCLEASYNQLKGVSGVISGYSGGAQSDPSYETVSSGVSGHAEVVKVTYDPSEISLSKIMAVFWVIHDPTSLNRQGADTGSQYASVVFYGDDKQKQVIEASRDTAQAQLSEKIMTRIEPLDEFYVAESYHQDYYAKNQSAGYCQVVIEPKLQKLREYFSPLLKT